jgi:hypothetical protein
VDFWTVFSDRPQVQQAIKDAVSEGCLDSTWNYGKLINDWGDYHNGELRSWTGTLIR